MRKHLNTLFVTTQGTYLNKEGETVVVSIEGEKKLQLPIHTLDGIVCFGRVMCSPYLMGFCADRDVAISFLSEHGRFLARVQGPVSGNVLLRREQYRRADSAEASASVAHALLVGKLANTRTVLLRVVRDHGDRMDAAAVNAACDHLSALLKSVRPGMQLDSLRGMEGDAARAYFSVFDHLIVNKSCGFSFNGRNRRPPLDPVNCLLSQDEIIHPFLEEKIPIGLLFSSQALLLARYLRGDLDAYPPFVWR